LSRNKNGVVEYEELEWWYFSDGKDGRLGMELSWMQSELDKLNKSVHEAKEKEKAQAKKDKEAEAAADN
jgi:hypothetical protein